MNCSDFNEGISNLAFGNESATAQGHVNSCARCAELLGQLRKIASAMNYGSTNAPQSVIDRAVAIGPPAGPRFPLLRSTLALLGARRANVDNFQRVFDGDGFEVRVMYSRTESGWSVMVGTDPNVILNSDYGFKVAGEDGDYEFVAPSLEETGFALQAGSLAAIVPPGSEPLENDDLA